MQTYQQQKPSKREFLILLPVISFANRKALLYSGMKYRIF